MYILNPLPLRVRDFFVSVLNRKVTSYTSLRNSIPVLLGSFLKEVYYEYYLRKIRSFVYTGRELLRLFTHARTVLRLRESEEEALENLETMESEFLEEINELYQEAWA